MKKIIILVIALSFALGAAIAFAAGGTWNSSTDVTTITFPGSSQTFQASRNVKVYVIDDTTHYAAVSKHLNGDREFGVSADSTTIYWTAATTGTNISASPSVSTSAAFSGWNSL